MFARPKSQGHSGSFFRSFDTRELILYFLAALFFLGMPFFASASTVTVIDHLYRYPGACSDLGEGWWTAGSYNWNFCGHRASYEYDPAGGTTASFIDGVAGRVFDISDNKSNNQQCVDAFGAGWRNFGTQGIGRVQKYYGVCARWGTISYTPGPERRGILVDVQALDAINILCERNLGGWIGYGPVADFSRSYQQAWCERPEILSLGINPPPSCDSGIFCTGWCIAPWNTCSVNNGITGSCTYTTHSAGGSCTQVVAPGQSCTLNNCSAGNICVSGVCSPVVNGSCGVSINSCNTGSLNNIPDSDTHYLWNCDGLNGGSTDFCWQLKPPPAPDIKADGSDGPITIDYDALVKITWNGAGATPVPNADNCTVTFSDAGGNWSGTAGIVPYRLRATRTHTLSCTGPGGTRTDPVTVNVRAPTLFADLVTSGNGFAPWDVSLRADVSGTAIGPFNYSFWWDCNNGSRNVGIVASDPSCGALPSDAPGGGCTPGPNGAKCNGETAKTLSVSHLYTSPRDSPYRPKVIIEDQGGAPPDEDRASIKVDEFFDFDFQSERLFYAVPLPDSAFITIFVYQTASSLAKSRPVTFQRSNVAPSPSFDISAVTFDGRRSANCIPGKPTFICSIPMSITTSSLTPKQLYKIKVTATANRGDGVIIPKQRSFDLVTAPPPTGDITANGQGGSVVIPFGGVALLEWTSNDADSCRVLPAPRGVSSGTSCAQSNGCNSSTKPLQVNTDYVLNCTWLGGNLDVDRISVNVGKRPPTFIEIKP
ncbi:MAG: hypothetical protein G01um101466_66 [Parcubacteria group bacterium Gr01-1014_66]|nr:MAG: hypothetical protein G01um101466_66 [Parcubacteria group bacterium Gr01-1014_66]